MVIGSGLTVPEIIVRIGQCDYIDAHTHLDMYGDCEMERVISEIEDNKILSLCNSMDMRSYNNILILTNKCKYIVPCAGIHPWKALDDKYQWDIIEEYASSSPMIGEIGLDFFWVEDAGTFSIQADVFKKFTNLACKYKKPVNIHTKGAEMEILNILKGACNLKSIIHWYSGPEELVDEFLALGCFFTISVDVLSSDYSKDLCSRLPLNRILPETDNPEGYPWIFDRKGYPMDIISVYQAIADIKGIQTSELKEIFKENLKEVFV